jgi:hypothetical protein
MGNDDHRYELALVSLPDRAGYAGGLGVEFRQNTIEQILESEYAAAASAGQRYASITTKRW